MRKSLGRTLAAILCAMLLCLVGCARGDLSSVVVSPTQDNVRLIGRTYEDDGVTWLPQSGSAIEFSVTGSRVEI